MMDVTALADFGLNWLEGSGPHSDIVLSTRVRLARNLQAHAFAPRIRDTERVQIYDQVRQVAEGFTGLKGGISLDLNALSPMSRRILHERHLISRELSGTESGEAPHPRLGSHSRTAGHRRHHGQRGRPPAPAGTELGTVSSGGVSDGWTGWMRSWGISFPTRTTRSSAS